MLGFLEKLTLTPGEVRPSDAAPLREVGISDKALEDAIGVCTCFNIIDRLADSLNFAVPTPEQFAHTAAAPQTHIRSHDRVDFRVGQVEPSVLQRD